MTPSESTAARIRVAIVAADPAVRESLGSALATSPDMDVLAWSDSPGALIALGTRPDVCLCDTTPPEDDAGRLRSRGVAVVVAGSRDPVTAVRAAVSAGQEQGVRWPQLSSRQRDVLAAYASSNDLLPTVARRLGMDPETVKTHLRRIRAKYADVSRPAPTRRDLYVRAVEDGLLPPPCGRG